MNPLGFNQHAVAMAQVLFGQAYYLKFDPKLWESMPILPLDQSAPRIGRGSKISIDATRQLPSEGRDRPWPSMNRALLEDGAPEALARVDRKWGKLIREWSGRRGR